MVYVYVWGVCVVCLCMWYVRGVCGVCVCLCVWCVCVECVCHICGVYVVFVRVSGVCLCVSL